MVVWVGDQEKYATNDVYLGIARSTKDSGFHWKEAGSINPHAVQEVGAADVHLSARIRDRLTFEDVNGALHGLRERQV